MQIDGKALQKILSMNDAELKKIISAAASEGGVTLPSVSEADIAKLRLALGGIGNDPQAMEDILKSHPKK